MTNSNQLRFLRLESERKKQFKLNGYVAEVASPSPAILVRPRFFLYISVYWNLLETTAQRNDRNWRNC